MTVYALDTNIVSYFLRKDQKIRERLEFELNKGNEVTIPPVVYFEVKRGLLAVNSLQKTAAFEKLCSEIDIGLIEKRTLDVAAEIYADLRRHGRIIDDADLLIAASCMQNGFTLVTNNVRHFANVTGLEFVNWL
jgi:predicted nucleic acid-binding protein